MKTNFASKVAKISDRKRLKLVVENHFVFSYEGQPKIIDNFSWKTLTQLSKAG